MNGSLFSVLRRSFKSELVTSLPDDLQEWLHSEAIQLQKPADEIVVDVLRRHRDATELWLSSQGTQRPITLAPDDDEDYEEHLPDCDGERPCSCEVPL